MGLRFMLLDKRLHDRAGFTCGVPALDDYLRKQASTSAMASSPRMSLSTMKSLRGCWAIAPWRLPSCSSKNSTLKIARLPAYPVPAIRMGRLAVSVDAQGQGYGQLLVGHAVNVALAVREVLGVRVLIVDAKDEAAARFYAGYGFRRIVPGALTLCLSVSAAERSS